ncbi:hypothetical protein AWC11_17010 [Mycobacterium interjectum]|nr:hypothetical protein AWC11_17010 [Mycobacterium interjectum]
MTNPPQRLTCIATQTVTAAQLLEMHQHLPIPLFVSDGDVRPDPRFSAPSTLAHQISSMSIHGGSSIGGREQITLEFADGMPGRVFDFDDKVDVHFIMPGIDAPGRPPH